MTPSLCLALFTAFNALSPLTSSPNPFTPVSPVCPGVYSAQPPVGDRVVSRYGYTRCRTLPYASAIENARLSMRVDALGACVTRTGACNLPVYDCAGCERDTAGLVLTTRDTRKLCPCCAFEHDEDVRAEDEARAFDRDRHYGHGFLAGAQVML